MADWNTLLRSKDFRAYRKRQVEMVAQHLKKTAYQTVTNGTVDINELKGKMAMINLFMRLPSTLTQDKEIQTLLAVQLDEDVSNMAKFLIRQSLAAEE